MSLPKEYSFNQEDAAFNNMFIESAMPLSSSVYIPNDALNQTLSQCVESSVSVGAEFGGSLMSVQSAPQHLAVEARLRPASLLLDPPLIQAQKRDEPIPSYLAALASPSEIADEDSLLTLSSVTARPLIAASKGLRGCSKMPNRRGKLKRKSAKTTSNSDYSCQPPDGGYGWFIVLGAFMVQFWVAGLFKSYGVLYIEIMETFPGSSASVASWIPAILSTLCLGLSPVSSALCEKYSCRAVVFVGGLFCAGGLALSYFATSLMHLLLSFGVLTGIGGGLSTTPGIVMVSQYFDKHRAMANGICVSGTAAGSFVFPMLIEKLIDAFGFHGTILLLGGGMLHVCVSATLYRPPNFLNNPTSDLGDETPSTVCTVTEAARNKYDFVGDDTDVEMQRSRNNKPTSRATTTTTEDVALLSFDVASPLDCNNAKSDTRLQLLFLGDNESYMNHRNMLLNETPQAGSTSTAALDKDSNMDKATPTNNLLEMFHPSLVEVCRPAPSDTEDSAEGLDVLGKTGLPLHIQHKLRLRPTRSSSLLHSVEDLSTDSTAVYKARGRGRGLSRSMYIKPPLLACSRLVQNKLIADLDAARRVGQGQKPNSDQLRKEREREAEEMSSAMAEAVSRNRGKIYSCISKYLDVSLLSDGRFALICGSVALMSAGSPYALYYLPAYTVAAGHTKSEAGRLVAISAVLDLCGRLGLGWLCDLHLFDRRKAYIMSILVAGLAVLSLPQMNSWWLLAFSSGCYGLCLGCWFLLVPVLLADIFGTARISSSYGLVRLFQSVAAVSVPPIAGLVRDVSGGYAYCFYGMGSCMVLGTIPVLLLGSYSEADDTNNSDDED